MKAEQFLTLQSLWTGNRSLYNVAVSVGLSLDLRGLMSSWYFSDVFPAEYNYQLVQRGICEPPSSAQEKERRIALVRAVAARTLPEAEAACFQRRNAPTACGLVEDLTPILQKAHKVQDRYHGAEAAIAHAFYCAFADPEYPFDLLMAWCSEGEVSTTDDWDTGVRVVNMTHKLPAKYDMKITWKVLF